MGAQWLDSQSFYDNILFSIIYSFHMPIFMVASGHFFSYSIKKHSLWYITVNKIKTLLVPIISWTAIKFVLLIVSETRASSVLGYVKIYLSLAINNLWFLWAIFWATFIVMLVHYLFKDNLIAYTIIVFFLLFLPDVYNSHLYKFMLPYFIGAYLINKKGLNISDKAKYVITAVCSLTWVVLMILLWNRECYIYTSKMSLLGTGFTITKQLIIDLYRYIVGMAGSIMLLGTVYIIIKLNKKLNARELEKSKIRCVLPYFGRNTMGLYIISGFLFEIIARFESFIGQSYISAISGFLMVLVISVLVNEAVKKIKVFNILLLGGR